MDFVKVEAFVLFVRDTKKSADFYSAKLGFEKAEESEDFASMKAGNANIALVGPSVAKELLGTETKKSAPSTLVAFEVKDLDEAFKELGEKGVKFLKNPKMQPWGQYTAYFEDIDGHVWEVFSWKKK